jgi:hypothetical protein
MKNNTRKIFAVSILCMFMTVFAASFVFAQEEGEAGVQQAIENPQWLVSFVNFMGFGETWSSLVISLAVLVMIFAAAFDILAFTAFESKWVKYLIAGGIAVVVSVARGITLLTATLMSIAGGSVAIATTIAIIMAVVFFVIGTFFKGKVKALKYKQKAEAAKGAYKLAEVATAAKVSEAKKVAAEAEK